MALYSAVADGPARVCRIRSTLHLDEMWCSEALLAEARRDSAITVEDAPAALAFNASGNLW